MGICSRLLVWSAFLAFFGTSALAAGNIKIAIDAEFGIPNSTSAQAIRNGAQIAVNEINAAGGVLGRKLEIVERDNTALPARSLSNLRALAEDPEVVAVLCGRFSPLVVEMLPEIHRLKLPLLDPWAAADSITNNDFSPSYVFRLSLTDTWALQAMMRHALKLGARKVGLLVPNTEWGRSSLKAAESTAGKDTKQEIVSTQYYNWGDQSLIARYDAIRAAGADAVVLVANDREANVLIKEMAALPRDQRLPLVAHWGITGGKFFEVIGSSLQEINLSVVQSYTFIGKTDPVALKVLAGLKTITGNNDARKVVSPVGVAHTYDLVHLLARAIKQANSTDRVAVRNAMEKLGPYRGLVRQYDKPFTAKRHDALSVDDIFMASFAADGAIEPIYKVKR